MDVLCAFAAFTASPDGPTARPQFVEPDSEGKAVLDIKGLWHPCAVAGAGGSIVPNDLQLGRSCSGYVAIFGRLQNQPCEVLPIYAVDETLPCSALCRNLPLATPFSQMMAGAWPNNRLNRVRFAGKPEGRSS